MDTGTKRTYIFSVRALLCITLVYHTMHAYDCPLWADHTPRQEVHASTLSVEDLAHNFPEIVQQLYTTSGSAKAEIEDRYRTYMTQLTETARIHIPEILTLISELDAVISSTYQIKPETQNNRSVFISQLQALDDALQYVVPSGSAEAVVLVNALQNTVQMLKNRI